jgi:hypothetical protein
LIFKEQHSIRRSLKNNYNPDIILTSGKMAKHELQILKNIYIDVLGSNRIENKYENIHKKNIKKTILVIPEAILSECLLLFCFSIKFAETYKDIDFVWRLHPLMNFKELASNGLNLQNLPNNVKLSNDRIEADIENCQYALYRGSSAVLKCISKGLRPIYLTISDEMTIDPLYRTKAYKWEVENIEQLNNLLINERLIVNNEQNDLIDHISNLMSIFDINVLLNLDKKIKISNTISC